MGCLSSTEAFVSLDLELCSRNLKRKIINEEEDYSVLCGRRIKVVWIVAGATAIRDTSSASGVMISMMWAKSHT